MASVSTTNSNGWFEGAAAYMSNIGGTLGQMFVFQKSTNNARKELMASGKKSRFLLTDFPREGRILIGQGAEADVFRCQHHVFGTVAVKMRRHHLANREDFELAMDLGPHSHIVINLGWLYANEVDENPIGYAMETLYTSLEKVIYKKSEDDWLPECSTREVEIIKKVCYGIHYLHKQGIIHRDVKPSNVLVSRDLDSVKVCDFGMSSFQRDVMTGGRGTVTYMAPEVNRTGGGTDFRVRYDEKCDVYSTAITSWELFHKRVPYDVRFGVIELVEEVSNGLRPSFNDSPLDLKMMELLRSAWHANPHERPSISELNRKLDDCT